MKKRCIIVPALNEASNIVSVVEGIKRYSDADIVVIDDGSKDRTPKTARETGAYVIRHPYNMGYGVALQTGYKYATEKGYDLLLQLDGDGQHDPKYIPKLFEAVASGECDVAIGSRFLGEARYDAGVLKSIGINLFRFMIRVTTGRSITDPTSGYQCLHRRVFKVFTGDVFPCDYPDADLIVMLLRMGFRIREVPVAMTPNPEGRSMHQGILRLAYYFFKMFLSFLVTLIREKGTGT
jgi:glycosyltransferase involved in cell wall biosynthesis